MKVATGKTSPGTLVDKDDKGKFRIVRTPNVDIEKWMRTLSLDGCEATHEKFSSPKGGPAVLFSLLKNPQNPPNQNRYHCILSIWGEARNDGVSLYFVARPYEAGTPVLFMKFREWNDVRGMSAILAVMAFHAEKPRLPRKDGIANEWIAKMRDKIQRSFYKSSGSFVERDIHTELVLAAHHCHKRFDSLAGLDVQESIDRVRKEFRLLVDHMNEDDVLKMWRETIVSGVLHL